VLSLGVRVVGGGDRHGWLRGYGGRMVAAAFRLTASAGASVVELVVASCQNPHHSRNLPLVASITVMDQSGPH
jgi:hypothetical protein